MLSEAAARSEQMRNKERMPQPPARLYGSGLSPLIVQVRALEFSKTYKSASAILQTLFRHQRELFTEVAAKM